MILYPSLITVAFLEVWLFSTDQISFPKNLDDSFHQGLLSNNESGLEKLNSESLNMWTQKGNRAIFFHQNKPLPTIHFLPWLFLKNYQFSSLLNQLPTPLSTYFKLYAKWTTKYYFGILRTKQVLEPSIPSVPLRTCPLLVYYAVSLFDTTEKFGYNTERQDNVSIWICIKMFWTSTNAFAWKLFHRGIQIITPSKRPKSRQRSRCTMHTVI